MIPLDVRSDLVSDYVKKDYAFTVNVSPKKFYKRKLWMSYTNVQQKEIFRLHVDTLCFYLGQKPDEISVVEGPIQYVFELTQLGHVHLHAFVRCSTRQILYIQNYFCKFFGMPNLPKQICCFVEETRVDKEFWYHYMAKEQNREVGEDGLPYSGDLNKCLF